MFWGHDRGCDSTRESQWYRWRPPRSGGERRRGGDGSWKACEVNPAGKERRQGGVSRDSRNANRALLAGPWVSRGGGLSFSPFHVVLDRLRTSSARAAPSCANRNVAQRVTGYVLGGEGTDGFRTSSSAPRPCGKHPAGPDRAPRSCAAPTSLLGRRVRPRAS